MQFKKCAVVGVLITLCLSRISWCHYIPEKKSNPAGRKNFDSSQSERIQICGKQLTSYLLEACNGILSSFNQANSSTESVQTKITEDCCDQTCSAEYLQSYCGETPLFNLKKTPRRKLLNNFMKNRPSDFGAKEELPSYKRRKEISKIKGIPEVRIQRKKKGKRKWGKSNKRKRSFKRKCAYRSFGHRLLKLERGDRVRENMAKVQNTNKQTWPSIQIGTISPEIDEFGGQPIVVVKKTKSNSV